MYFTAATVAGSPDVPNEDWVAATSDLIVVLDGATIRTETGCRHGAAWYTRKLGTAIVDYAAGRSRALRVVLASAIHDVATLHPECDLDNPGTPSAAVGIVAVDGDRLRYLLLGDVTVVLDGDRGVSAVSDQRIGKSATAQRTVADRYSIGTPEKAAALVAMKHAELAARNTSGGYWIAAADPMAAQYAITGALPLLEVRRLAVLTDGAARAVDMFGQHRSWSEALDAIDTAGIKTFIRGIRSVESADPLGARYPRNKTSDDATVVYAQVTPEVPAPPPRAADWGGPELTDEQRWELAETLLRRTRNAYGDGMAQRVRAERAN
ncbi:MAG: protein phosphatase 2C domain-containing protein [Gammaproteobacteria bacterium]